MLLVSQPPGSDTRLDRPTPGTPSWHTGSVADLDRLAAHTSDGLRRTLERLQSLVAVVVLITLVIGAATFATGWWVFDAGTGWLVVGGIICFVPFIAGVLGWWFVRATASAAPRLIDDVRAFLRGGPSPASGVLIDHDSGVALGTQARSLSSVKSEVRRRRLELPALWLGVRAITGVPGLAAIAVVGTLVVGALGTVLLIGGLID